MDLVWRDKADPAVMMFEPVPPHESKAPVPGFLQGNEAFEWIVGTVFAGPEHGLGVGLSLLTLGLLRDGVIASS